MNNIEIINHIFDTNIEERWAYGSALHVTDTKTGIFKIEPYYTSMILEPGFKNILVASIPAPNVLEGHYVRSVMLRYHIEGLGKITMIEVRRGERLLQSRSNLSIGQNAGWETLKLSLSGWKRFKYGLGVVIYLDAEGIIFNEQNKTTMRDENTAKFYFASVGLEFAKSIISELPDENSPGQFILDPEPFR